MGKVAGEQLGLQLRDAALDRFSTDAWLARARQAARQLLIRNGNTPIIIDDVREIVGPPPRPNMAGAVFRSGFRFAGYAKSPRPEGHSNLIRRWTLA